MVELVEECAVDQDAPEQASIEYRSDACGLQSRLGEAEATVEAQAGDEGCQGDQVRKYDL